MSFPALDTLQKNQMVEVLNKLFDENRLKMIGDLNKDEIKLITAILLISDMKHITIWEKGVNIYMELLLSKNRESRKEIITTIAGLNSKKNILQKLGQAFKKDDNYG